MASQELQAVKGNREIDQRVPRASEREGSRGLRTSTFTIPRNYGRTRTHGATKNLSNNCRSTIHRRGLGT